MNQYGEAERFAARLRALRERSGLSYDALARKAGLSRSSLHRYCAGSSVPQDYGAVHRVATVCGATAAELRELHRLWALADTERERRGPSEGAAGTGEAGQRAVPDADVRPALGSAARMPIVADQEPGSASASADQEPGSVVRGSSPAVVRGSSPAVQEPATAAQERAAGEQEAASAGQNPTIAEQQVTPAGQGPATVTQEVAPASQHQAASAQEAAPAAQHPATAAQEAAPVSQDPITAAEEADRASVPGPPEPAAPRGWVPKSRRAAVLTAAAVVAVLGTVAWAVSVGSAPDGAAEKDDRRPLFSPACAPVVSMGQHDACVREVQTLLERRGAVIGVDGDFGPQTLRRVTAFQVIAGLPPNGVVTADTKKALYESKARMDTWSPAKVRERIRAVFKEVPDDAVAIADCQSFLDPLHILPNTNGSRNWGLFQISDGRLRELGGTPGKALEPEWNIQAAKRLWTRHRDFHDWPYCERGLRTTAPSTPSAALSPTP